MADIWSREKRSEVMGLVRNRHTGPEIAVRKLLHRLGFRFTVNGPKNRGLPGKPDIVLPRFHTVILVHGCFWHRHRNCRLAATPKSNGDFWNRKFAENVTRDRKNLRRLRRLGWRVVIIWECQVSSLLANPTRLAEFLRKNT